jgi:hypothetical protein
MSPQRAARSWLPPVGNWLDGARIARGIPRALDEVAAVLVQVLVHEWGEVPPPAALRLARRQAFALAQQCRELTIPSAAVPNRLARNAHICELYQQGYPPRLIAAHVGVHRATVYRVLGGAA